MGDPGWNAHPPHSPHPLYVACRHPADAARVLREIKLLRVLRSSAGEVAEKMSSCTKV